MRLVMNYLGTMFFILTPFGFFCTENGTGMITGITFLILGFLCKSIGNGAFKLSKKTVRVTPKNFWEYQYRTFRQRGLNDKNARDTANYITNINRYPIPLKDEMDKIARTIDGCKN